MRNRALYTAVVHRQPQPVEMNTSAVTIDRSKYETILLDEESLQRLARKLKAAEVFAF
ncbi:hypothetical protein OH492_00490 [Vibrio chagasii]|nr:hypothetical protein [Vibrio chagasii]